MSSVIASRRYAYALLTAADEGNFLEEATRELAEIGEVLKGSRDLVAALRSPLVNVDQKAHILEEVFSGKVSEKMLVFLRLIAKKKRAGNLPGIVDEFSKLMDEKNGIIGVDVTSAAKLSDEQAKELVNGLAAYTGKKVRARMLLDEQMIGGLSVKIGDTILDGSVRHQLQMLRQRLSAEQA